MAERVGRGLPGTDLAARARRVPTPVWSVIVVAAVVVVVLVVTVVGHSTDHLSARVSGIAPQHDPRHFAFSYDLTKNPQSIASCTFEVQDADHGVVGHLVDRQEPTSASARTVRHRVTADTSAQGVTAVLDSCRLLRN